MRDAGRREVRSWRLRVPRDFDLVALVAAHGWYQLAPLRWVPAAGRLERVLRTPAREPVGLGITQEGPGVLRVRASRPLGPRLRRRVESRLTYSLALDMDLAGFHAHCRRRAELAWIARRRLGRFLRGEEVFEDLAKVLLTTNCTWRQTVGMVGRLTEGAGPTGRGGLQAFPGPQEILARGRRFLERGVRAGYRSGPLLELARAAAGRDLEGLLELPDGELLQAVQEFRGFGPYAASSILMLWGRGGRQVVDSWALARARERFGARGAAPRALERRYAVHGPWRGLVAWFDLNRDAYRRMPPDWLTRESHGGDGV